MAAFKENGATGSRDKTGAIKLSFPFSFPSLAEALAYQPSASDLGTILPVTAAALEHLENGEWKVVYTCEGLVEEAKPDNTDVIEVEFDGSMGQQNIKKHPRFDLLEKKFGKWVTLEDGRMGFPQFLPKSSQAQSVNAPASSSKLVPNRAYGTESYKSVEAIFRATYTRKTVPARVIDEVGTIVDEPYYWHLLGIAVPEGRDFLVLAPKIKSKGNGFSITEEAQMSGPGGSIREIYNYAQLGGSSLQGTGLQSSGLQTSGL